MQCNLALHLGRTLGELSETLTEQEFGVWCAYRQKHSFPFRRLEFYLAQIAMLIARTMGGAENVSLQDYLFDPQQITEDDNIDVDAMAEDLVNG